MLIELGLGLALGSVLALTGAGGGILAVPMLVFGMHLSVAQAGPIGLLAVGAAAALGALHGLRKGIVRYKAALLMAGSGILLSPLGLWLAHRLDNRWLGLLFAVILFYIAFRSFRKTMQALEVDVDVGPAPPCVRDASVGRFIWTKRCANALALSGGVAGVLSGLLGVGGGFVMVPALQRYTDLQMQSVVATSLSVIALVSLSVVVLGASTGRLDWSIAVPFCIGALAGMTGGRLLAAKLSGAHLQKGFALIAVIVAGGMVFKSLG